MPELQEKIKAVVKLGELLREFTSSYSTDNKAGTEMDPLFQKLEAALVLAGHKNGWFTADQVLFAFEVWGNCLEEKNLLAWLKPYEISGNRDQTVALIMAGNIPLVGFHDLLAVILSGHKALVKLSSNDNVLLPALVDILDNMVPGMQDLIRFEEARLSSYDKVIATGSNNTSRYFEYYFSSKPHVIRKNRNSVALLTGNETKESLIALGQDVFQYYGLGCRSVSKIFVPEGYSFEI
ncbi:MAG: acyl-CoA reductase, partial [Eudoraea sp.]|nr:acyl-CoA reductase [Eudoraea sp.]NNJ40774.1 acyl-CoA reductase [Eudoraea sp.]